MRAHDRLLFEIVNALFWRRYGNLRRWVARKAEHFPERPHVGFPRSANDKMTWRKVFDRNPLFTKLSDKIALRDWAREEALDIECPALLWRGKAASDIPQWVWDGDHVIKTNHASGTNVYTRDPGLDRAASEHMLQESLDTVYGANKMEWGYLGVVPQILVEPCLPRDGLEELKVYTFGATCWRVFRSRAYGPERRAQIWEMPPEGELNLEPETQASVSEELMSEPLLPSWDRALKLASEIGAKFDHVRVDFLAHGDDLWLSELTFYNQGGLIARSGHKTEGYPAELWNLNESWAMQNRARFGWRSFYLGRLAASLRQ